MKGKTSNSETAKTIITAMNTRDLSVLERHLGENAAFDFPGTALIKGKKRILAFLKVLFRKYPTLTFFVQDTVAEEDKACILWTNRGENTDGKPYANRGVTFVRLSGGKILFISDYFKDTSFTATG